MYYIREFVLSIPAVHWCPILSSFFQYAFGFSVWYSGCGVRQQPWPISLARLSHDYPEGSHYKPRKLVKYVQPMTN